MKPKITPIQIPIENYSTMLGTKVPYFNEQINLVCQAIRKLLCIFWDTGFERLYLTHKSGIEKIENVCISQVQG